jgi:arginase
MQLETLLVPFDVDRDDTPVARSPRELINLGLLDRLEEMGVTVRLRRVGVRSFEERETTVSSLARAVSRRVTRAVSRNRPVLVLTGGCLTAVGVVHGLQQARQDLGVLWLDAHGDFQSPETTVTGYWDGMALAAITGRSLASVYEPIEIMPLSMHRIVHFGGRDLEPVEAEDFERLKIFRLPTGPSQEQLDEAAARLRRARALYFHFDLDGLDPGDAPAVNLKVASGVHLDALLQLVRRLPEPAVVTLSGANFENAEPEECERQLATSLRLISAAFRLPRAESDPPPDDPDPDDD